MEEVFCETEHLCNLYELKGPFSTGLPFLTAAKICCESAAVGSTEGQENFDDCCPPRLRFSTEQTDQVGLRNISITFVQAQTYPWFSIILLFIPHVI
jgi:hypothetical protein